MSELQVNFHKGLVMYGFAEAIIKNYLLVAGEFEKFVSLHTTLFEEKHGINFLYDYIINRKLKEDTYILPWDNSVFIE